MNEKHKGALKMLFTSLGDPESGEKKSQDMGRYQAFHVDVYHDGATYLLQADLPGCTADQVEVVYDGEFLEISAKRTEVPPKAKVLRKERAQGYFHRSFQIEGINRDSIRIQMEHGVLWLEFSKKP